MKPSLVITFIVAGALSILGIVASAINNNVPAAVWALAALVWVLAALNSRIDIETLKRVNDIQEEIIKAQEDLIENQKEIIKELEQEQ